MTYPTDLGHYGGEVVRAFGLGPNRREIGETISADEAKGMPPGACRRMERQGFIRWHPKPPEKKAEAASAPATPAPIKTATRTPRSGKRRAKPRAHA